MVTRGARERARVPAAPLAIGCAVSLAGLVVFGMSQTWTWDEWFIPTVLLVVVGGALALFLLDIGWGIEWAGYVASLPPVLFLVGRFLPVYWDRPIWRTIDAVTVLCFVVVAGAVGLAWAGSSHVLLSRSSPASDAATAEAGTESIAPPGSAPVAASGANRHAARTRAAANQTMVLIVDDIPETLSYLSRLVQLEPGWAVAGRAMTGRQAIEAVERLHPDVVLMDVIMPELDGISATEEIHRTRPDLPVVVMSIRDDADSVMRARKAGACGFLVKPFSPEDLHASLAAAIGPDPASVS